jgi:hypothetical protein
MATAGEKDIKTDYPVEEGLIAPTQRTWERDVKLYAEEEKVYYGSSEGL